MLKAETEVNSDKISALTTEQGYKAAQNVVAGVAGAFFIIPLFLMDVKNAAGIEKQALEQRNQYILSIAQKKCDQSTTTDILKEVERPGIEQAAAEQEMQQRIKDGNNK